MTPATPRLSVTHREEISSHAPLAAAVLGHRPDDRVTVTSPGGVYGCWIVRRERSA